MSIAIRVHQVTKCFGGATAVDRVSLEIPPGCVFALLGENGAGKTTLVRMLLGLLTPDEGEIEVFGLASTRHGNAIRSRTGYVPERPTLYEWMTAAEIGWFTAGFYPDGFEHRYRELLAGFRAPLGRKIGHMSKGMRAKVALALAMAHDPELLVLDEPTSGLDTLVRREFLQSMVDWAAKGHTVLLSSHLIGEVERVADHVAVVREGKLLLVDRLDALKQQTLELTVTMEGGAASAPTTSGELLRSQRRGRQWQLLLRGADETELDRLTERPGVVAVESRTPSLEEIFVALMQSGEVGASPAVVAEVV